MKHNQSGQVLTEILIAVVVAGIVIGGIAGIIGSSLISGEKAKKITTANGLAQEDIEAIKAIADNSWINIYCPPSGSCPGDKGATTTYSVILSNEQWEVQQGVATTTINELEFTHYFIIENVTRNESGDIVSSGGEEDPSTQKITVYISWQNNSDFNVAEYITRSKTNVFIDQNWNAEKISSGPYAHSQGYYASTSGDVIIHNSIIKLSN